MAKLEAPYINKTGKVTLDSAVFGEPFHMALVHQAARADLNARRRGTASTLTRGEVSMTTAKAFRQKGTGRARAGALSTPNRYGGGVAFGPKPRSYTIKINRKARRKALRSALSVHAERGSIGVCDPGGFDGPSTKTAFDGLSGFGQGKALVVVGAEDTTCAKSFRNLTGVEVRPSDNVGIADIIGARRLIVTPSALDALTAVAADAPATEVAS
jgi:large subunit ribosomal protein L4